MSEPEVDSRAGGRAALLVAAGIFLSRIAGLAREIAIAALLPVNSVGAEAFRFAVRIPNTLQNLLGEGALSASLIPVYSRMLDEDREEAAAKVAGVIATLLALLTGALVFFGVVAARPITAVLVPGRRGPAFELTVDLVRIMFPGTGFLVLSAWCLGVLNSHRRFFLSYVAPVIWNLAQIALLAFAGLRGFTDRSTAMALAWGLVIGSLAQLLVQLPTVRAVAPAISLGIRSRFAETGEVLRRFVPATLGRGIVQLSALVDQMLATYLAFGVATILGFTQVLYLLPISLFGMSVAAAELPELTRTAGDRDATDDRLRIAMRRVVFFVAFTTIAYMLAGRQIVSLLFEQLAGVVGGDSFDADASIAVWLTLAAYSLGLVPAATSRVVQNALYAHGDVRGPAIIALGRLIVSTVVGLMLMFQFDLLLIVDAAVQGLGDLSPGLVGPLPEEIRDTDGLPLRLGAVGLGLASAVASWAQLGLLERRLRRRVEVRSWIGTSLRWLGPAVAGSAVAMTLGVVTLGSITPVVSVPLVVGGGGAIYVVIAHLRGVPEATRLLHRFGLRF